jgi:hypothetical protein
LPNCWRPIFLVLPKLDGCQVDLSNCWSCSNFLRGTCGYAPYFFSFVLRVKFHNMRFKTMFSVCVKSWKENNFSNLGTPNVHKINLEKKITFQI